MRLTALQCPSTCHLHSTAKIRSCGCSTSLTNLCEQGVASGRLLAYSPETKLTSMAMDRLL